MREYGGKQCRWPTIQPGCNFSKKMTIFTMGFLFLKPGAITDLGTYGKMGRTKWQNSKTSPLVFILFPFTFRTTDEQQFGFA